VFRRYGSPDVLELAEIEKPTPAANEVLIRVHAVSLNDWDWGALDASSLVNRLMFGVRKPKKQILGSDVAGRIEAVGEHVTKFHPGDEVFGDLSGEWGGFAEYVCAREDQLALKSAAMTFEQAAAIPQAAMLALQGLRDSGRIEAGQKCLINGAGGGVGTFAIQLARHYGADITAVDSADKFDMMRSLGADHLIDYTKEDFTSSDRRYDLILDVRTSRSVLDCARVLKRGGIYVTVGGSMFRLFQGFMLAPWISLTTGKRIRVVMLKANRDLAFLKELFEAGKLTPAIDGPYALSDVPDAFRYFGEGRHKGKVVVTPIPTPESLPQPA